jgi:glycine/D-amino acid oxidase-like deaminating enzyme
MAKQHIAVIGAGAFGGWTAWHLLERGYRVTLIDAYDAGHSRASSGDETRIIRSVYQDRIYIELTQRAIQIWQKYEPLWGVKVYHPIGVLNLNGQEHTRWQTAMGHFQDLSIPFDLLSQKEAARRFPSIHFEGIKNISIDTTGGYMLARMGCYIIAQKFVEAGGDFKCAELLPLSLFRSPADSILAQKNLSKLKLSDGSTLKADAYVFACGSWLGKLFPDLLHDKIKASRQEAYYFGLPAGNNLLAGLPVWCDYGAYEKEVLWYGIPARGSDAVGRGFKIAKDVVGTSFDPDADDRLPTPAFLEEAKQFMAFRFPLLKNAPLIESRVCPYEMSPDAHFIIDRLPMTENAWIVGGGSGHGYKMGAAIGEMVADLIAGKRSVEPIFSLKKFEGKTELVSRR